MQEYINSHLEEVEGFQMFDCSYYYYLYISVIHLLAIGDHQGIINLLDKYVLEDEIEYKSDKMKNYYLYLVSVKYYYAKNYDKCFTCLMKGRNYFSTISANTFWVCLENVLLSVLINIQLEDYNFIYSELDFLKRLIKKNNMQDLYANPILNLQKGIKHFENDKDKEKMMNVINALKDELNAFKLIYIKL